MHGCGVVWCVSCVASVRGSWCLVSRQCVCGVWCVVCGVWCVVCGVWCVVCVCGVWCVVCGVWCVVCGVVVWCVVVWRCGAVVVWCCVVCGVWCGGVVVWWWCGGVVVWWWCGGVVVAILAQAIFVQTSVVHTQREEFFRSVNFALHWAPFVRNERHQGWSDADGSSWTFAPDGSKSSRGPRPKSEKWPLASFEGAGDTRVQEGGGDELHNLEVRDPLEVAV